RVPRVGCREAVDALEEARDLPEREERMRDRRVAPIEHPPLRAAEIDVHVVEVVVLDARRYAATGELGAQYGEGRRERTQAVDLPALQRERSVGELVVARRERLRPPVRHAVREMFLRVVRLADLKLGVPRQYVEPDLRRIAFTKRSARVCEEQPRALFVVCED